MADACYCDYGDSPDVYAKSTHKARIAHKCYECGRPITPGERYERVASLYDGHWTIARTCCRCLSLREYLEAHAPCFCWLHGSMLDDAQAVIEEYGRESAGFFIGSIKRLMRAKLARPWATDRNPFGKLNPRFT